MKFEYPCLLIVSVENGEFINPEEIPCEIIVKDQRYIIIRVQNIKVIS